VQDRTWNREGGIRRILRVAGRAILISSLAAVSWLILGAVVASMAAVAVKTEIESKRASHLRVVTIK